MNTYFQRVQESVSFLKNWLAGEKLPEICVVLGSGLAAAIPKLKDEKTIDYSQIPGFKKVTVEGHIGQLCVGTLIGQDTKKNTIETRIAFLRGRNHGYESNNPGEVVHSLRTLVTLGAKRVILTNASGCLNPNWQLGAVMSIRDHINQTGTTPTSSEFGEGFGKRFVDLSTLYDVNAARVFQQVASELGQTLYEGVYYGVGGPDYETPSEIKMMRLLGADAVGMSTVLEAIAAKHLGATVSGLSCLTNYGAGIQGSILEHDHVVQMGKQFSKNMAELLVQALPRL